MLSELDSKLKSIENKFISILEKHGYSDIEHHSLSSWTDRNKLCVYQKFNALKDNVKQYISICNTQFTNGGTRKIIFEKEFNIKNIEGFMILTKK